MNLIWVNKSLFIFYSIVDLAEKHKIIGEISSFVKTVKCRKKNVVFSGI